MPNREIDSPEANELLSWDIESAVSGILSKMEIYRFSWPNGFPKTDHPPQLNETDFLAS